MRYHSSTFEISCYYIRYHAITSDIILVYQISCKYIYVTDHPSTTGPSKQTTMSLNKNIKYISLIITNKHLFNDLQETLHIIIKNLQLIMITVKIFSQSIWHLQFHESTWCLQLHESTWCLQFHESTWHLQLHDLGFFRLFLTWVSRVDCATSPPWTSWLTVGLVPPPPSRRTAGRRSSTSVAPLGRNSLEVQSRLNKTCHVGKYLSVFYSYFLQA